MKAMETEIEEMSFDECTSLKDDIEVPLIEKKGMGCDEHNCLIEGMKAKLGRVRQPKLESNRCIYEVPQKIREKNPVAYTPKEVSIGPFHHGDKKLEPMEELKLGYLKSYLQRTNNKLEDCIGKLKEKEEYFRSCYAGHISHINSDDFVKILLTDACFIIEYFFRFIERDPSDPILSNPWWMLDIRRDLILLENQLPFFVLEDLFTPTRSAGYGELSSFLEVSCIYLLVSFNYHITLDQLNAEPKFNYFYEHRLKKRGLTGECKVKVQHLTDILRNLFLPEQRPQREGKFVCLKYSASRLLEAGLKFKVGQNNSLIELQFKNGVLTMPQLLLEDVTETFLLNIAALEQCHYPDETYIGEYVVLLDFLINDREDVDILVDKGVMVNFLGDSRKVVAIFEDICMGMALPTSSVDYFDLCTKLNCFYEKSLHKYKTSFIRDYLSTPWKIASFVAATLLLLLTLTQTICSIVSLP